MTSRPSSCATLKSCLSLPKRSRLALTFKARPEVQEHVRGNTQLAVAGGSGRHLLTGLLPVRPGNVVASPGRLAGTGDAPRGFLRPPLWGDSGYLSSLLHVSAGDMAPGPASAIATGTCGAPPGLGLGEWVPPACFYPPPTAASQGPACFGGRYFMCR